MELTLQIIFWGQHYVSHNRYTYFVKIRQVTYINCLFYFLYECCTSSISLTNDVIYIKEKIKYLE